jgi:hypothetical protein
MSISARFNRVKGSTPVSQTDMLVHVPVEQGRVIMVPPGNTETAVNRRAVRY